MIISNCTCTFNLLRRKGVPSIIMMHPAAHLGSNPHSRLHPLAPEVKTIMQLFAPVLTHYPKLIKELTEGVIVSTNGVKIGSLSDAGESGVKMIGDRTFDRSRRD